MRPVMELRPFEDAPAMQVLGSLDIDDAVEAAIARCDTATPLALFADWRAMEPFRLFSAIAWGGPKTRPFAVLSVSATGARGVAQAALLACNHRDWRRELAALAARCRDGLPGLAVKHGLTRIEARCFSGHPSAGTLLRALGFEFEADLLGYGPGGLATFRQFAWTRPKHPMSEG